MWAWLNPLTWIKIFSLIKTLIDSAVSLYNWGMSSYIEWKQKRSQAKTDEALHHIDEANMIEDDAIRLGKKKEAASELEKSFDSNKP